MKRSEELPHGIYTDGKRVPTLVRAVRETKVAVAGKRGKWASRVVKTTSNQVKVQEHLPVVALPCYELLKFTGKYATHKTRKKGKLTEKLVTARVSKSHGRAVVRLCKKFLTLCKILRYACAN